MLLLGKIYALTAKSYCTNCKHASGTLESLSDSIDQVLIFIFKILDHCHTRWEYWAD